MNSLTQTIQESLARQPTLRQSSLHKRKLFALDLALIALGFRTAWLVDTVAVENPERVFADLLNILRTSLKHQDLFKNVEHVLEPSSQYSFFVNTYQLDRSSLTDVQFIFLRDSTPELLAHPPADVQSTLAALKLTNLFPPDLTSRTLIPIAAVLLGYPVAYCIPEAPTSAFLARTPLDVYTCSVRGPNWPHPHTMLKFSCPAELAANAEHLEPIQIVSRLKAQFEPRATELGLELVIVHHTETLDRVAL
ncbi:hypothetical protein C8F01DRAFT_1113737 [Mycena amicta]|nr:hypothetical protein C8F01DRAFT_1113737 [Mycena amicta]